jgi:PAS domain S-box-containing protein
VLLLLIFSILGALATLAAIGFKSANFPMWRRRVLLSLLGVRRALDVMPEGFAFYDKADRLAAWNTHYEDFCRAWGVTLVPGMPFTDLLKAKLAHGAYPNAIGRETEWLSERLRVHSGEVASLTQQTATGRWLRVTDRRTTHGAIVSVMVDITDLKHAEAAMAEARDRAQMLAKRAEAAEAVAGLGHWRLDARTNEVTWSKELYRIYGLSADDPLHLDALMAMTHPDDAATATATLERQLSTGKGYSATLTRILRPSGETRYMAGNSQCELGPDGEVLAVVGTLGDVTDQALAEMALAKSEARFRHLTDHAPDMITEAQLDGTMTYVSSASFAVTGFTPEELIGRKFSSLMEPEDALKVEQMCQAVFGSKGKIAPWPVEFRATRKDGQQIWLECKPVLAIDPTTGRYTVLNDVVRDITRRKMLEAELRAAQAEAEAAATAKGEFLANMSHELRTPLTSVVGFVGLLAEQADLTESSRTYVERISAASGALLCTVNDILDFSKLEAGQVTFQRQPTSVSALGKNTLDLFTPQAGAKDLDLFFYDDPNSEDLWINVDPNRIRQVLLNLVGNAVKFTASGRVILRMRYDPAAERLRVEVIDSGMGVPPEKQSLLFQRFSQIDGSLTRVQGGTGLGLAICKGLVEAMGGEIGVESHVGEGSRFWFTVPASLAVAPLGMAEDATSARPSFLDVRVLVVDDNTANRELARLFLSGVGVEVTEAVDGEDAVRLASEQPFDVILMDVRMPNLDGPGALRRIRAEGGPNDAIPILAFTADSERFETFAALGFQGLVSKPVEPGALLGAIAQAASFLPHDPSEERTHAG